MNYMLLQLDCPPIIISHRLKQEYLNALHKTDKAVKKDLLSTDMHYYKPLMDFMEKQFVKTYWDNFVI